MGSFITCFTVCNCNNVSMLDRHHPSEIILIASGVFILVSVGVIFYTGDFSLWLYAKILYVVGVILFAFNK